MTPSRSGTRPRMTSVQDEPDERPRSTLRELAGWLVSGVIVAAAGGYWLAVHSSQEQPVEQQETPTTTAVLPQIGNGVTPTVPTKRPQAHAVRKTSPTRAAPRAASRPQNAHPAKPSTVAVAKRAPAPAKAAKTAPAQVAKAAPAQVTKTAPAPAKIAKTAPAPTAKAAPTQVAKVSHVRPAPRAIRSARRESPVFPVTARQMAAAVSSFPAVPPAQARGPLVNLAAFPELRSAKLVWRDMERAYPGLKQYRPWIIANRDWNGHIFYQFQLSTGSLGNSQMLCYSMQRRDFRCEVVAP